MAVRYTHGLSLNSYVRTDTLSRIGIRMFVKENRISISLILEVEGVPNGDAKMSRSQGTADELPGSGLR